ncbi:MAG TPA: bifunctional riboflavin kinase/FAD synthetase [Eubacteriaceae bacterium]|nr:bifunctional riboflavin kinase/FAD synthetase [Eubacteriaceae bacterium]
METYDLKDIVFEEDTTVVLGFFDGIHLGHQALIDKAVSLAKESDTKSIMLTFKQHPLSLIFPEYAPKLISSQEQKKRILKDLGMDYLLFMNFTEEMMNYSPEKFIRDVLSDRLKARHIVVGFNYSFGKKGEGKPALLKEMAQQFGYQVHVVNPIEIHDQIVSSTLIRNLIGNGHVEKVEEYLGRPYALEGRVVKGKGLGRQYAIPTANMRIEEDLIVPESGVYYTNIEIEGKRYHGLTNVGYNPTFQNHPFSIETYIFDFNREIYQKKIQVAFLKKVRDEKRFDSVEELMDQIKIDMNYIKKRYILKSF